MVTSWSQGKRGITDDLSEVLSTSPHGRRNVVDSSLSQAVGIAPCSATTTGTAKRFERTQAVLREHLVQPFAIVCPLRSILCSGAGVPHLRERRCRASVAVER
eukprot:8715393-Pyramimonas_sp.AAC.1